MLLKKKTKKIKRKKKPSGSRKTSAQIITILSSHEACNWSLGGSGNVTLTCWAGLQLQVSREQSTSRYDTSLVAEPCSRNISNLEGKNGKNDHL